MPHTAGRASQAHLPRPSSGSLHVRFNQPDAAGEPVVQAAPVGGA